VPVASECWRCGAPWRCRRCGSFERRPNGKGCAECHRLSTRARTARDTFEDIVITPAISEYLQAFDRYVLARRDGDTRAARQAGREKARVLDGLTDDLAA
jgi:hypothetical protein